MSIFVSFIMLFMILGIGIAIPTAIGIYVYRDAKRRGMNAVLWTLIALLAPSLVGFIIYLIVRGSYSDMECPNCQTSIKEDYVRCPKCGSKLRPSCPKCSMPIEPDWTVCPRCATPLPESQNDTIIPVKRKDKSLGRILIAVILVPIILIALLLVFFTVRMSVTTGSGGISIVSAVADEYLQEVNNDQITEWYNDCKNDDKTHVLRYESIVATGEQSQVRYLVYMQGLEDPYSIQFDSNAGFFGTNLRIDYSSYKFNKGDGKDRLILITCTGDDADLDLEIYCDDDKMDFVLEDSDSPINLTDNVEIIGEVKYNDGGQSSNVYIPRVKEGEQEIEE